MSRSPGRRPSLPLELDPRHALARAGRGMRTPVGKLSMVLAALVSIAVLAVSSVGWAAVSYFDNSIHRLPIQVGGKKPPERPGDENVLLVGDDSREGTNGEYGTQAEVGGLHSDTVIVAHLGANGTVALISIPRDTLVDVPAGVANTPSDGRDKLTNVLANGGINATIKVVQNLTGLTINHFITIDLNGFKKMTDAVGGVTVCVSPLPNGSTTNLNDNFSQWHGHLGNNTLNGDQALAFVRTRHALGDERLRIQRQQVFLADLLRKATSAGVLTNPVRIASLIGAVGGSITVDSGLNHSDMVKLAQRLKSIAGGARFITLPTHIALPADGAVDDQGNIPPHGDVLIYDRDKAEPILAPLRPVVKTTAKATPGPTLPATSVRITEIRNDTGRSGLAGTTRLALSNRGFIAMAAETATGTIGQVATEVHYPAGAAAAANTLAAAIPGATTVADPTVSGLVLVLGSSFDELSTSPAGTGATASTAAGNTTARATPSPAPTEAPPAPNCTP